MRIEVAEILLAPDAPATMGTTVYANNRTHHLPYFWVPGDERRLADGNKLTYMVDGRSLGAYTRASFPATEDLGDYFDSTFTPWTALRCGNLNLEKREYTGSDPTIVDDGVGEWWLADIVVGGWMPLPSGVLGVTYTYTFVDENGDDLHQVSFNQSHDRNPVVLSTGEIMFSRWDHVGERNQFTIFKVNPDGTNLFVVYGAHSPGNSYLHPREMPDGRIMAIARPFDQPDFGGDIVIMNIDLALPR